MLNKDSIFDELFRLTKQNDRTLDETITKLDEEILELRSALRTPEQKYEIAEEAIDCIMVLSSLIERLGYPSGVASDILRDKIEKWKRVYISEKTEEAPRKWKVEDVFLAIEKVCKELGREGDPDCDEYAFADTKVQFQWTFNAERDHHYCKALIIFNHGRYEIFEGCKKVLGSVKISTYRPGKWEKYLFEVLLPKVAKVQQERSRIGEVQKRINLSPIYDDALFGDLT